MFTKYQVVKLASSMQSALIFDMPSDFFTVFSSYYKLAYFHKQAFHLKSFQSKKFH